MPHSLGVLCHFLHNGCEVSAQSYSCFWGRLETSSRDGLAAGGQQRALLPQSLLLLREVATGCVTSFRLLRHSQLEEFRPGIAVRVLCKALICKHGVVYFFYMVHIIYINNGLTDEHLFLSLFWYHVGGGSKS